MSDPLRQSGVTAIAVVETTVAGVHAYHAWCITCGWRCHRTPHDRQATAVRHAEAHECTPLERKQQR